MRKELQELQEAIKVEEPKKQSEAVSKRRKANKLARKMRKGNNN